MVSYVTPKKGVQYIFYAGLPSRGTTGQFQSNPTIAAGDFKVSIDGGALANLATLPAVTPASSKMVKFTLSTSEMNGDNITIVASDAAGSEWNDLVINIQTTAQQIDDLSTQASVNTIDDFLDTEIAAIKTKTDFLPSATAGASGGLLISGSNSGTTTLGALTVTGTATISNGLSISRSSANTSAVVLAGNGTGHGIQTTGGATGHGILSTGGATSGDGIRSTAATSGKGINAIGIGTTQPGILATGGTTTSAGIQAVGGATSGDGILVSSPTLGHGASITGAGASKHGMNIISGTSSGNGMYVQGGSASGDGIKVVTTSGHGLNLAPVGTDMHGILSTGGNAGTSDGIKAVAGTGGVDIRGAITGNITGNLSGSVGSVTGLTASNLDVAVSTRASQTSLDTLDDFVDTEVAAIKAKTDNLPADPADASDIAASFTTVNTKLDTIDDFLDTEVAAIKAKTDNLPAAPAAVSDIPTANANADALLDRANGVETGITLRQALRLKLAALAGKLSGAATTTIAIRDATDTKDRITATVDADGNRTAVTLDAS